MATAANLHYFEKRHDSASLDQSAAIPPET